MAARNHAPRRWPRPHPPLSAAAEKWVELGERISVCARTLRERVSQAAAQHDLTPLEFTVLFSCRQRAATPPASQASGANGHTSPEGAEPPGLSQNQIALAASVSPAHVSGLVEQLRIKGLLSGQRSATDRRRQHWQATPTGAALLQSVLAELAPWAAELDEAFGPRHADQTFRLLDRLSETLLIAPADASSRAPHKGAA